MKKLLIAGGGHADIPMILAAKKLGYYTITSGNNPKDLGHQYSDKVELVDFSNKEQILQLAQRLKIDAIVPCCNDFSALSSAYAAEKLGFSGHDTYQTAKIIHHKDLFKKFTTKHNLSSPKALWFQNKEEAFLGISEMKFPIIVKPIDLSGGKGISVIREEKQIAESIKLAFSRSKAKRIVAEEFIEGDRHGYSTLIKDQKIVFSFLDDEHYFLNPYLVSGASFPSLVSIKTEKTLKKECEKITNLLKLKDGLFHVQFIVKNEIPYIIEICRRPPGDLYVKLVEYVNSYDYPTSIVKAFCGNSFDLPSENIEKKLITRHCLMSERNGIIDDIIYSEEIKGNIFDKMLWWKKGDIIENKLIYKAGILFLEYENLVEMKSKVKRLTNLIKIKMK